MNVNDTLQCLEILLLTNDYHSPICTVEFKGFFLKMWQKLSYPIKNLVNFFYPIKERGKIFIPQPDILKNLSEPKASIYITSKESMSSLNKHLISTTSKQHSMPRQPSEVYYQNQAPDTKRRQEQCCIPTEL